MIEPLFFIFSMGEMQLKSYFIQGGSETSLFVVEGGNPKGKPIVFIHGASQNHLN